MVLLDQAPDPDGPCDRALLLQIEGIRVTYPRWQRIVDEIGRCHGLGPLGPLAAEPPCLLLVGPTGAGKSTLVGSYARQYPPLLTETGATYPVVRATIPAPATIKALATTLLAALGDQRHRRHDDLPPDPLRPRLRRGAAGPR